jgi:hypothetical protein
MIGPETYVPTCTVFTGFTVPVALTASSIGPRSTATVSHRAAESPAAAR